MSGIDLVVILVLIVLIGSPMALAVVWPLGKIHDYLP